MLADPGALRAVWRRTAIRFAHGAGAAKALAGAQVIAFSAYASDELKKFAQVILPIGLLPEIEATLSNLDGVAQSTSVGGKLPGDARPGWRVLRALAEKLGLAGFDFTDLAGLRAQMKTTPMCPASAWPRRQRQARASNAS